MQKRPNILIISADSHRYDCLGVAGRKVKTPNLDALAKSGVRFGSCITPSVACQPARASILTGQLCRTHGLHDDGLDLDPSIGEQGFAGTLSAAGYDTSRQLSLRTKRERQLTSLLAFRACTSASLHNLDS